MFGDTGILSSNITNGASSWLLTGSSLNVSGTILSSGAVVLASESKLLTINFTLPSGDTKYLFSTSEMTFGSQNYKISPVFVGTLSSGQLQFVNDGTTLGTVTDNTLHFSQDSSYGVHIKYDTNSAIGTLSQSSEIYITGFTSTIQNLVVL